MIRQTASEGVETGGESRNGNGSQHESLTAFISTLKNNLSTQPGFNDSLIFLNKSITDYFEIPCSEIWIRTGKLLKFRLYGSVYAPSESARKFAKEREELLSKQIFDWSGNMFRESKPKFIEDSKSDHRLPGRDHALKNKFRSVLNVPIELAGQMFAVFVFFVENNTGFDEKMTTEIGEILTEVNPLLLTINELQQVREECDELKNTLDVLSVCYFRTDLHGNLSHVNQRFAACQGVSPSELVGKPITEYFVDGREKLTLFKTIKEKRFVENFSTAFLQQNGEIRYVLINAVQHFDLQKNVDGIEGVIHDVTALRHEEASLKSMLESGTRLVIALDTNLRVTFFNRHSYSVLLKKRLTRLETGMDFTLLFNEDERDRLIQVLKKILAGESVSYQSEKKSDDGTIDWYQNSFSPIKNAFGKIEGAFLVIEDITDKKKKDHDSERFYKTLTTSELNAIIFDPKTLHILNTSKGMLLHTGFSEKEMSRKKVNSLLSDMPDKVFSRVLQPLLANEESEFLTEHICIRKDKTQYPAEIRITHSVDEDGGLCLMIITNIVKRRKQESALKSRNRELLKSNFELDRFVYSASHDLKAPLRSAIGLINLAKRETTDNNTVSYLEMMNKSLTRLDSFINDLIHFSRNSRLKIEFQPINFEMLINDAFENLKYMEESKKVAIQTKIKQQSAFSSDPNRLGILFSNLISNAIKYQNPEVGYPFVSISVKADDKFAEIIIKDNGIGIGKEHHKNIFKMFYRASEQSKGSGLGLYIVREIVTKLKGTISVNSIPGQGSEFILNIPNALKEPVKKNKKQR